MTVYIDSLFLVNFFMDTAVLLVTAFMLKKRIVTLRLLIGSVFLSLYGCFMFFEMISFLYSIIFKILAIFCANFMVFGKKGILKNTFIFCVTSVICGGLVFAISCGTDFGSVMQTMLSNLVFYININPIVLCAGCVSLYLFAEFYRRICTTNFLKDNFIVNIVFTYMGRDYEIRTLIDTGCSLKDPLSGVPILVASKRKVVGIVPSGLKIKSASVGGEAELDLILPEKIVSKDRKYEVFAGTMIGLSFYDVGEEGLYDGVINPEAILYDSENIKICNERNKVNAESKV